MDAITKNPGFQHISEDIFKLMDKSSLMNCRLVNSSWKNILDQPTFWLKKFNSDEEVQRSWKILAENLDDQEDQVSNVGVKVRNMKMDFNIYGTWRRVGQ